MFQPRRWLLTSTLVTLVALFGQPHSASAQSTLHIGPGAGLDPVRLTGSTTVTVSQTSNGATALDSAYQLFIGIPTGGGSAPTISSPETVAPTLEVASFSSGDAYTALGLGGLANNSQQFVNWQTAEQQFLGNIFAPGTPTSFGIYSYDLTGAGIELGAGQSTNTFTFSSSIPVGSFVFAFGTDLSSGQSFSTPFTQTGLVVPEPGPLLGAGVVTLLGLGYTWQRRKRATA
jgi:hypothetical protein